MRKTLIIRFSILAIIALAALLVLRSAVVSQSADEECTDGCCQKKSEAPTDNLMIWDTFSRQFISICF